MSTCPRCGFSYPFDTDRCPNCYDPKLFIPASPSQGPQRLSEWKAQPVRRMVTETPFDGIASGVPVGAVILLSGAGGIGKSSWALRLAGRWPAHAWYAPYETGPEKLRQDADRLQVDATRIWVIEEDDARPSAHAGPESLVVIDSLNDYAARNSLDLVQAAYSARHQRNAEATILLLAHVNKLGDVAGPEQLKHDVDVWIELSVTPEGQEHVFSCRQKNRYGPLWEDVWPAPWAQSSSC